MRGVLHDSLVREKVEGVPLQLGIWLPLAKLTGGHGVPRALTQWVWGLRLMEACYRCGCFSSLDEPLIEGRLLRGVLLSLPSLLQPSADPARTISGYLASSSFPPTTDAANLFAAYLSYYSVPHPLQLTSWCSAQGSSTTTFTALLLLLTRHSPSLSHPLACLLAGFMSAAKTVPESAVHRSEQKLGSGEGM